MVKRSGFITRRPDLSVEAFHSHWLNQHAELVKEIARPRRYVVNLIDRRRYPDFPFDGFSELWFDEESDWDVLLTPGSVVKEDEKNFTQPPNGVSMTEHVIVDGLR
jgi:uncharacterized protein (TIGR02118 family)